MRPIKYAIYKGMTGKYGAVQFSLAPPVYICSKCKYRNYEFPSHEGNSMASCDGPFDQREGAVFVEVANPKGNNIYDWDNKIIFAMGVNDLGKALNAFRSGHALKLLHDPGAQSETAGQITKTLNCTEPSEKGILFSLYEKNKSGEEKKFSIPISSDEFTIIGTLLSAAITKILGW